jgi:hypothetical protein
VDVSSGEVFLNDSVVSASATTVSHSTSDPEDRIDLITVNSSGTVSITQGSPAATSGEPVAPDIPTDEILASLIYVRGGSSEILSGDIFNDYKTQLELVSQSFIESINHSFLSNVQSDQHHAKPTGNNIRSFTVSSSNSATGTNLTISVNPSLSLNTDEVAIVTSYNVSADVSATGSQVSTDVTSTSVSASYIEVLDSASEQTSGGGSNSSISESLPLYNGSDKNGGTVEGSAEATADTNSDYDLSVSVTVEGHIIGQNG